jgi:hypothetical protein
MSERLAVYLESGPRRAFAGAIDWPGWSRSGRSDDEAVATLVAYAGRYAAALATASVGSVPSFDDVDVDVVERLVGSHGTDFGVPSATPSADARPLPAAEATRLVAILRAAWSAFDAAVAMAEGHELRLGPRGGGRDLARMVAHVREAERAYLNQLGVRTPRIPGADEGVLADAVRARAGDAVVVIAAGRALDDANKVTRTWMPRYHVRRAAWHALDHAWELEDRRIDRSARG